MQEESVKKPKNFLAEIQSLIAKNNEVSESEPEIKAVQKKEKTKDYFDDIKTILEDKFKESPEDLKVLLKGTLRTEKRKTQVLDNQRVKRTRRRVGGNTKLPINNEELYNKILSNSSDVISSVKSFLKKGGSPNHDFKRGITMLHLAKNKDLVVYLIEMGANVNARDYLNRTPLHYATKENLLPIVEILLDNGADIEARDSSGWTAMIESSRWASHRVMEYLISHKANINAIDDLGNTALHIAVSYYRNSTTTLLLSNGILVDVKNLNGDTALHIACKERKVPKEQPYVIATLISHGADITITNANNQTAKQIANKYVKKRIPSLR